MTDDETKEAIRAFLEAMEALKKATGITVKGVILDVPKGQLPILNATLAGPFLVDSIVPKPRGVDKELPLDITPGADYRVVCHRNGRAHKLDR